jgi:hypothetical protein
MNTDLVTTSAIDNFDCDDDDSGSGGALRGGALLRCGHKDGHFSDRDHNPIASGTRLIVIDCDCCLQRFPESGGVETLWRDPDTGRLPDHEQLNEQVPVEQWRINKFTGQPEAPWKKFFAVYLLDPATGGALTYLNSSASASIAYVDLKTRIRNKRLLCNGAKIVPVVELRHTTWHSRRRGLDIIRPDFRIVDWLTRGDPAIASAPPVKAIGAEVTPQPVDALDAFTNSSVGEPPAWHDEAPISNEVPL